MSLYRYRTSGIEKIKKIYSCIFEKDDIKHTNFFIIGNYCFTRYKSRSRAAWLHLFEEIFISSRQYLANVFMKNNHYLDFWQEFVSTAGVNTAFFHWKIIKIG